MKPKAIAWTIAILLFLGAIAYGAWRAYDWFTSALVGERCWVLTADDELSLSYEQSKNAAIIVAESYERGLPEQAAVIALATAWQESTLRNIDYGDRDSVGLFQQRPSQGWGTVEEIMDPWYSSGKFYEVLVQIPDWETGDVNDVAQAVQRSGHPNAYRKHEENARALASALRGTGGQPAMGCVDRGQQATDPTVVERVVAAVPGATMATQGKTLTIQADNAEALWSATNMVVANTRAAGVTTVTVEGNFWDREENSSQWDSADAAAPEGTAVIQLR